MAVKTKPYLASPPVESDTAAASTALAATRRSYFSTSIGTKVLMAVTGLLLVLYLILHLVGNLLVFLGPGTFNTYSDFLIRNPLIVPVEIGLLAVFVIHVYKAVTNWLANRRARPVSYYQSSKRLFGYGWAGKPSRKSIASTTMIVSGIILFAFIVLHLFQFKFGTEYTVTGTHVRDLYRTEMENFSSLLNVGFYMFAMIIVGFHLWHGFSSAFNSLGAAHPRYTPWVLGIGRVLAIIIAGGFLMIPLWVYFYGGR